MNTSILIILLSSMGNNFCMISVLLGLMFTCSVFNISLSSTKYSRGYCNGQCSCSWYSRSRFCRDCFVSFLSLKLENCSLDFHEILCVGSYGWFLGFIRFTGKSVQAMTAIFVIFCDFFVIFSTSKVLSMLLSKLHVMKFLKFDMQIDLDVLWCRVICQEKYN